MPWEDSLDDFEKSLAADKDEIARKERHRDKDQRSHRNEDRNHHHHHRSHKGRDRDRDRQRDRNGDADGHRSKRRRRDSDDRDRDHGNERSSHSHRRHRHRSPTSLAEQNKPHPESAHRPEMTDQKRDSWMEAPSSLPIDYIQRKRKEPSPPTQKPGSLGQDFGMKVHEKELNHHLRDLRDGKEVNDTENNDRAGVDEVDYTFGDAGSSWRMTKLRGVYKQAETSGRRVEDVAGERYGSLRGFDDAREEEREIERRDMYGAGYVGKEKPSGELYQERKLDENTTKVGGNDQGDGSDDEFDTILDGVRAPAPMVAEQRKPDQTAINKLKAQLMKAEMKKDPNVEAIRKKYEDAVAGDTSSTADPSVIQLSAMDNRMLSSAPRNEVKAITNRRGQERGNVEENEDMSIEDMVAEERRTKQQSGGEAQRYAERIAKDAKFDNDLDYMDENANKLAKRVHKSDINLRNVAIGEYQKVQRILETCPLCHHEDRADDGERAPVAPVVSLATRTYLTLPTKPELASYSCMIVPMQHHTNLLHCDDDEWEEIRNFMKSLTRFYHSRDQDVIFYENAAFPGRRPHAAMVATPLPLSVGETSPAFFKEAFLTTESEWSQHKKIIDTLGKAKDGAGKMAFRRMLAKEMPYFHVWFEMDGGLGHIVEDPEKWPRGDLFAREVVGGMLGLETEIIKKQGRWVRGVERERVEAFRKRWRKWDWTRALVEGGS